MATYTYTVTVAAASGYGSGNRFYLQLPGGSVLENPPIGPFVENDVLVFNQGAATNAGHPLGVGPTNNQASSAYGNSNGVSFNISGVSPQPTTFSAFQTAYTTAKNSSNTTAVTVTYTVPASLSGVPTTLYYFCGIHSGMGNTITLSSTADSTLPVLSSVTINDGDSSTNNSTVTVKVSGTDAVGITGVYLSESSTISGGKPSTSLPDWRPITQTTNLSNHTESFNLSAGLGSKVVYAWLKDAAGNVSASGNDSITLQSSTLSVLSGTLIDSDTTISADTEGSSPIIIEVGSTLTLSGTASFFIAAEERAVYNETPISIYVP